MTDGRFHLHADRQAIQSAAAEAEPPPNPTTGYIHSIETAGTLDGPGIRFVLFLTGCHLRCQYCHNPDTWHIKTGRKVTVDAVMAEITTYARFLKTYKGGVTFSGGEALVQMAFLEELVRRCKALGLHTAIDTNGYLGEQVTPEMMADVDLWILDLKAFDATIHKAVTGADNGPILAFAQRLSAQARPMWIRFVLVPGLTDQAEDVEQLADFIASLDGVARVEVLPFHQMGAFKWRELGIDYRLADTEPPSPEHIARVRDQFAAKGLCVV